MICGRLLLALAALLAAVSVASEASAGSVQRGVTNRNVSIETIVLIRQRRPAGHDRGEQQHQYCACHPDRWHGNGRCDDHPERHAKLCRRDPGGWHDQFGDRSVGREQHCRYHSGRQFHQRPPAPDRRYEHGSGTTIRALQLAIDISVRPVMAKVRCSNEVHRTRSRIEHHDRNGNRAGRGRRVG